MADIRAKFKVMAVTKRAYSNTPNAAQEEVTLSAVYSSDKVSPNYTWSQATPAGQLTMTITNPDAVGALELGAEYYLDFTRAEEGMP